MHAMDDRLVGYLLNALDDDARREVESYVQQSSDARRKLELLRTALAPLESDRDDPTPPAGLAERTLAQVKSLPRRRLRSSPRPSGGAGSIPSRWRRTDLLVASLA